MLGPTIADIFIITESKMQNRSKYKSLKEFVEESRRNEMYVYHTGNLAMDRATNATLNKRAAYALEQYVAGFIELVQVKNSDKTDYVAVRTYHEGKRPFVGCYREGRV